MKRAIVIGATSGIGKELARVLSQNGYILGITGRRLHLLEQLQAALPNRAVLRQMDVTDSSTAMEQLAGLITELVGSGKK